MPRAPLAAPWCSLLLCAAPLGAFPLAPACDTSRLEGWSVNADGGDGLVFRIDPAGEPGGRPHLALEFVRGARGWGNLAAAVAVTRVSRGSCPRAAASTRRAGHGTRSSCLSRASGSSRGGTGPRSS